MRVINITKVLVIKEGILPICQQSQIAKSSKAFVSILNSLVVCFFENGAKLFGDYTLGDYGIIEVKIGEELTRFAENAKLEKNIQDLSIEYAYAESLKDHLNKLSTSLTLLSVDFKIFMEFMNATDNEVLIALREYLFIVGDRLQVTVP